VGRVERQRRWERAGGRQGPGYVQAERPLGEVPAAGTRQPPSLEALPQPALARADRGSGGPEDVLEDLSLQFELLSQGLDKQFAHVTRQIIVEKVGPVSDITWLWWGRV
jgi:hypothetical protein